MFQRISPTTYFPKSYSAIVTVPFDSVEESWFWFIQAYEAQLSGARLTGGEAIFPRPCEPIDILRIIERLYRQRRLLIDHVRILTHYGRRLSPPNRLRPREVRAFHLWKEALEILGPVLRQKGIVL